MGAPLPLSVLIRVSFVRFPGAEGLPLPSRATPGSAGYDLRCAELEVVIPPGERVLVGTGFAMALPAGLEAQVRPRSGLALRHGVTLLNSPGTIDPDYRGEVKVLLQNHGREPFTLRRGDRVAQLVFAAFATPLLEETVSLPPSGRGEGGFGSTGTG